MVGHTWNTGGTAAAYGGRRDGGLGCEQAGIGGSRAGSCGWPMPAHRAEGCGEVPTSDASNAPGADDASVSTAGYRNAGTSCAGGPLRTASPDPPAFRRGRRTPPEGVRPRYAVTAITGILRWSASAAAFTARISSMPLSGMAMSEIAHRAVPPVAVACLPRRKRRCGRVLHRTRRPCGASPGSPACPRRSEHGLRKGSPLGRYGALS